MMGEFNAKDANFLWRQIGRIDGVIETLNRTEGEMPEIIAGVLKRIRDDIDKFVDNKTRENMKYRGLLLPMILAAMCGDDAFVLNTKRGKGMQSTYRREKIVRIEKEFDINGTKVMAYSTEMLIPEGSEHLFKDIYTAKADELYHHVLDKFGWAWRDPKYKSETELCAMLKWAKEKGLTIEELSI